MEVMGMVVAGVVGVGLAMVVMVMVVAGVAAVG
jgi:hypothetical protein